VKLFTISSPKSLLSFTLGQPGFERAKKIPKSEARNPKQIQMTQEENPKRYGKRYREFFQIPHAVLRVHGAQERSSAF